MPAVAVVLAAGAGERLGRPEPKAFVELAGRPLLLRSVEAAAAAGVVSTVVAVVPGGWEERAAHLVSGAGVEVVVVAGGETRHGSVGSALLAVPPEAPAIVVHDAARPFATPALFDHVVASLGVARGVVPALPVADTVKRVHEGVVVSTEDRSELFVAQTPQGFDADAIRDAHARAAAAGLTFTDDAAALEWAGYRVRVVPGEAWNRKVTTPEDLAWAEIAAAAVDRAAVPDGPGGG